MFLISSRFRGITDSHQESWQTLLSLKEKCVYLQYETTHFMLFLAFLIILIIVLGGGFLAWENSASLKGIRGESRLSSILSQLSEEYTTLNDLVFRTEKGTTQIDHIVISKYGVFVIETKTIVERYMGMTIDRNGHRL